SCKELTKRRLFARGPTGPLAESTLDGGTPPAGPFYNTEQAACRGLRRRVKPFCNLCDSRWPTRRAVEHASTWMASRIYDARSLILYQPKKTKARVHSASPEEVWGDAL